MGTPDDLADDLAYELERMWAQLDPVDDWRPLLDKAAAELRRLAAVETERDELRQLHERTIIEGGKKLGEDLSDEPRAKWLLLGLGRVVAERDQLRAEVEALRDDCENARELARPVCDALKVPILHDAPAAIEALRADAERYRWLRQAHGDWGICEWDRAECEWVRDSRGAAVVDAAVDAARKDQSNG